MIHLQKKLHLIGLSCLLALAACSTQQPEIDQTRRPLGKADAAGTCEGHCGGKSEGSCWCDEQCDFYGDCCDDKVATCDAPSQVCGGFLGDTCGEGDYCHFTNEAICGWADATGVCQPLPEACIEIFAPVCGCDSKTYDNSCFANFAGTSVAHDGACEEQPTFCGGFAGTPCPDGQVCIDNPDDDCDPANGGADCIGVCEDEPSPQFCGGFANLPCPEGLVCVDNPNDLCDPANGGADCGGICVEEDEGPGSETCTDSCGGKSETGSCWCDDLCEGYGDCCEDKAEVCAADPERTPASGVCIKNSNDECETDADCNAGGCGGELCYNPEVSSGISTCECFAPTEVSGCGCVNGSCTWYNE